jgi:hypothetical protein
MVHSKKGQKPKTIKLFCGLIGSREAVAQGIRLLCGRFGESDYQSRSIDFGYTRYYSEEMGEKLLRKWVSFQKIRERAYLVMAKHTAVALEEELSRSGKRTLNIDPGYVDDAQVVLSTSKNYSHRIYIGMGYYAEVTLVYKNRAFQALEWTYPDYKVPEALQFFDTLRSAYLDRMVRS